jgi:hypothetical protein
MTWARAVPAELGLDIGGSLAGAVLRSESVNPSSCSAASATCTDADGMNAYVSAAAASQ